MSGDLFDIVQGGRETINGTLHDPAATTGHVLTVQADKSIKAQPGGGAGGVQVVTVNVTSAQIKALFTTPVTLVAGVAGQVIVPTPGVGLVYVAGATPYTDNGGAIFVNTGTHNWYNEATAGFWDQADSQFYPFFYANVGITPVTDLAGQDLVLLQDTANPTLGNGTLKVTVAYFLAPTV